MKVKCLQCGREFELEKTKLYCDSLGRFTVCPYCGGSFDVDVEDDSLLEDLRMEQQEQA